MTPGEEMLEEAAESVGLVLAEHFASCGTCAQGGPCDEADELVVACLEWSPFPRDGEGCELGGEG